MKAGAQRLAAALGLALLMPDTSPRGAGVAGEADSWDFGVGAGFNLDATQTLRHPGVFKSLSALAPICAPTRCTWGRKALGGYLGVDESTWAAHDASALMQAQATAPYPQSILIDQGEADKFLADQLLPEAFESACAAVAQPLKLRRHAGYDHDYYFVASMLDGHLRHHARQLSA